MNIEDNPLVEVAMEIIIHAGDARERGSLALKHAKKFELDQAELCMKEAKELIIKAHKAQTDVIQKEAGGASYQVNFIFIHAQDTLMTIKSELNMAGELIDMYKVIMKHIER